MNLEDKPYKSGDEDLTLGKAVANILAITNSKDPIKSTVLAMSFYKEKEVEVSAEDIVFIKGIITTAAAKPDAPYIPLIMGQVLQSLEV